MESSEDRRKLKNVITILIVLLIATIFILVYLFDIHGAAAEVTIEIYDNVDDENEYKTLTLSADASMEEIYDQVRTVIGRDDLRFNLSEPSQYSEQNQSVITRILTGLTGNTPRVFRFYMSELVPVPDEQEETSELKEEFEVTQDTEAYPEEDTPTMDLDSPATPEFDVAQNENDKKIISSTEPSSDVKPPLEEPCALEFIDWDSPATPAGFGASKSSSSSSTLSGGSGGSSGGSGKAT